MVKPSVSRLWSSGHSMAFVFSYLVRTWIFFSMMAKDFYLASMIFMMR